IVSEWSRRHERDKVTLRGLAGMSSSAPTIASPVADVRRWKDRHQCVLVGTAPSAATDYQAVDYRAPTVLLFGGERKGLSSELRALCDVVVRIPMTGDTDSLNLAIAASLLLYDVFNHRRRDTSPEEPRALRNR